MCHSLLPNDERKPGGVEQFVHQLSNRLVTRGHEVVVFTYSFRPRDAAYEVAKLGPESVATNPYARFAVAPLMFNRLDRRRVDILHFHGDDWFFLRRGVPVVRTFYGSALDEARFATSILRKLRQYAVYPLELLAASRADARLGFGPGNDQRYRLQGHLFGGVDPVDEPATSRSARPSVLFVGTWSGRKRGAMLHRIFEEEVRPVVPTAELWMVSDYCVPTQGVIWFPRPRNEQLAELYSGAWLFCSVSSYEGFGLPALEAMAHGVAVVSTPNPGITEVSENGEAAVIVDDTNVGTTLVRLLRDADLRSDIATRGWLQSQRFAWARTLDAHERVYRELLAPAE